MHPVRVDTPPVQDVIEDSLRVHDVVVARGEGARVLVVAAVPGEGGAGGVTGVVRVEARVTGYPELALVTTQVSRLDMGEMEPPLTPTHSSCSSVRGPRHSSRPW